jgi:hypothetical protein
VLNAVACPTATIMGSSGATAVSCTSPSVCTGGRNVQPGRGDRAVQRGSPRRGSPLGARPRGSPSRPPRATRRGRSSRLSRAPRRASASRSAPPGAPAPRGG